MSQVEENWASNKSGSSGTVVASLAAVGSVIAASSCCLPVRDVISGAKASVQSLLANGTKPAGGGK